MSGSVWCNMLILGNHSQVLADPEGGQLQAHLEPDLLDQQGLARFLCGSGLLSEWLRLLDDLLQKPGE